MAEPDAPSVLDEIAPAPPPGDEATMAELRSLLLGPAEAQIAEVHARLTDPQRQLKEVVRVLPAAVTIRARQDRELAASLSPLVAASLNHAVRKNPQPLADALFPIMGPAIRKAIAAALSGLVEGFNQSLTHSFSWQGLKWRLEALRTGRSFAEVVLLHSLLYRVEQVFLIHKETGLLLQQVVAGNAAVQDADMVSGMLTAIQDFVRDSFQTRQGDGLETLSVGELNVWVVEGPWAVLAAVIRGKAPESLRALLQETVEKIHFQFADELTHFRGDASAFAAARPALEDCLQFDLREQRAASRRQFLPLGAIAGLLLVALSLWAFFSYREARRWNAFVERLQGESGLVVTDAGTRDGRYFVSGLRDPLARDPQELMREARIDPASVTTRWEPFLALTPPLILARARRLLDPPPTVRARLENGVLELEGYASHKWVEEARRAARLIPGIEKLKEEQLLDLGLIENPRLMFEVDRATLVPGQEEKFARLVADIERLSALAATLGQRVELKITGHTDRSGTEARNSTLSEERARTVAAALEAELPARPHLVVRPLGSTEKLRDELTEEDRAANRSVTFEVVATDLR